MSSTPHWSEEEEEAIQRANQAQIKASVEKRNKQKELEALPARVQALEDLVKKLEQKLHKPKCTAYDHPGHR